MMSPNQKTPDGRTLTLRLENNRWQMRGGKYGDHDVANDGDRRVAAHWAGYCEANGIKS